MFNRTVVLLKTFAKFIVKYLWRRPFWQSWRSETVLKKDAMVVVFTGIVKIFQNNLFKRTFPRHKSTRVHWPVYGSYFYKQAGKYWHAFVSVGFLQPTTINVPITFNTRRLSREIRVRILQVVNWSQASSQPSQLESAAATRISCT